MFKIGCLLLLLFCATSCVSGGSDDTSQNDKPPVNDDKKQYKENILDFSGVSLNQYLAENNDKDDNIVTISLNKSSARALVPDINKANYRVNLQLLAGEKDYSSKYLKTQGCTFDANNVKCQIHFFEFKDPGVYTLSFSYDGVKQTKQMLLYVADRHLVFEEAIQSKIHRIGQVYNVSLTLNTNLASEHISVPLSVSEGICVIGTGSEKSDAAPSPDQVCLPAPTCDYDLKSSNDQRVCYISYVIKDVIKQNSQSIDVYRDGFQVKFLPAENAPYVPTVCAINGIEAYDGNSAVNKSALSDFAVGLKSEPQGRNIKLLFCDAHKDDTYKEKVKIYKDQPVPMGESKDILLLDNQKTEISSNTIELQNGTPFIATIKYNPDSKKSGYDEKIESMGITITSIQDSKISKELNVWNSDEVPFLKISTLPDNLDDRNFNSQVVSLDLHAHQQEDLVSDLYLKAFNIKNPADSQVFKPKLYVKQCLYLESVIIASNYTNCKYDYQVDDGTTTTIKTDGNSPDCTFTKDNEKNICITSFKNTMETDPDRQIVTTKDFPLTMKISKYAPGAATTVAVGDDSPDDFEIAPNQVYHLTVGSDQVSQLAGASLKPQFGYTTDRGVVLFNPGELVIHVKPQQYQILPEQPRVITIPSDSSVAYTSRFYVTARPGASDDSEKIASHNLRLVLADNNASDLPKNITVFRMVAEDKKDSDSGFLIPAQNTQTCDIKDTKSDKGCICIFPKASDDNMSCNFEIQVSKANTGDNLNLKFVDASRGYPVSNRMIEAQFKSSAIEDTTFLVRDTKFFDPTSEFQLAFAGDNITVVKKDENGEYPANIFDANAIFVNSGYYVSGKDSIVIFDFPGKHTLGDKKKIDLPEIKLYSKKGCYGHNSAHCDYERGGCSGGRDGTQCTLIHNSATGNDEDWVADSVTCTIPAGAMSISVNDGTTGNQNCIRAWFGDNIEIVDDKKQEYVYEMSNTTVLHTLFPDKPNGTAYCSIKNANSFDCDGGCGGSYNTIAGRYIKKISCTTKSGSQSNQINDYTLSQNNDTRNKNSKICFGVEKQYLIDDGNFCGGKR